MGSVCTHSSTQIKPIYFFNHKQKDKYYTKHIFYLLEPSFFLGLNNEWRLNAMTRALFTQQGKSDLCIDFLSIKIITVNIIKQKISKLIE